MALQNTIRDLHRRKARERRGLALAEGVRLIEEMLLAGVPCKGVAVAPVLEATPRGVALLAALDERQIPIERVSDVALEQLAATEHPQGIVAVYAPQEATFEDLRVGPRRPVVVLDGVLRHRTDRLAFHRGDPARHSRRVEPAEGSDVIGRQMG